MPPPSLLPSFICFISRFFFAAKELSAELNQDSTVTVYPSDCRATPFKGWEHANGVRERERERGGKEGGDACLLYTLDGADELQRRY